jgi:predicted transcriptional regulator
VRDAVTGPRDRIASLVRESPGVHFRGLVRSLDLAPGQVQYHVRHLQDDGRVASTSVRGRTHYFEPSIDEQTRRAVALLRRETARDVVVLLAAQGPASPTAVTDDLDIARSTLEHHLSGLVAADLVRKAYDERGRVTLALGDEALVARGLSGVRLTLPERLVDRFTRLIDDLLEDA